MSTYDSFSFVAKRKTAQKQNIQITDAQQRFLLLKVTTRGFKKAEQVVMKVHKKFLPPTLIPRCLIRTPWLQIESLLISPAVISPVHVNRHRNFSFSRSNLTAVQDEGGVEAPVDTIRSTGTHLALSSPLHILLGIPEILFSCDGFETAERGGYSLKNPAYLRAHVLNFFQWLYHMQHDEKCIEVTLTSPFPSADNDTGSVLRRHLSDDQCIAFSMAGSSPLFQSSFAGGSIIHRVRKSVIQRLWRRQKEQTPGTPADQTAYRELTVFPADALKDGMDTNSTIFIPPVILHDQSKSIDTSRDGPIVRNLQALIIECLEEREAPIRRVLQESPLVESQFVNGANSLPQFYLTRDFCPCVPPPAEI